MAAVRLRAHGAAWRVVLLALLAVAAVGGAAAAQAVDDTDLDWSTVDDILTGAIDSRIFPGAVAAVRLPSGRMFAKAYGTFTYGHALEASQGNPAVTLSSRFDLASLTKVVATTTAAALLYQRGLLHLDTRVSDATLLGPRFATHGKEDIRVSNLLLHNTGFPPDPVPNFWDPAFGCAATAQWHPPLTFACTERIFESVLATNLTHAVGTKYVYSDLSMITLAFIIGTLVQQHGLVEPRELNQWCAGSAQGMSALCHYEAYVRTTALGVLDMPSTGFLPPQATWPNVVPSWNDTDYRHRIVQGQVSDGNSYASGGIAGHAGLFSTAGDLVTFMAALLTAPSTSSTFLDASTVTLFTTVKNTSQSSRALGWDTNNYDANSYRGCGDLSSTTFTHTGYTGTQLCGDPERQLVTVLLTNRVYPNMHANSHGIHVTRQAFNNAVKDIVDACATSCGTAPLCSCSPSTGGVTAFQVVLLLAAGAILLSTLGYLGFLLLRTGPTRSFKPSSKPAADSRFLQLTG